MPVEELEYIADFYGDSTLDEFSDRLGITTFEMIEYLSDLIDDNIDDLEEEMLYNKDVNDEEED
jgi:hypothetical protein